MSNDKINKIYNGKRHWKNYLLKPRFQLTYGLIYYAFFLYGALTMFIMMHWRLKTILNELANVNSGYANQLLIQLITNSWTSLCLFTFTIGLATFPIGILISHRVAGPIVALKRQIEAYKSGDYSMRTRLRREDSVKDLSNLMNEFGEELQKRK